MLIMVLQGWYAHNGSEFAGYALNLQRVKLGLQAEDENVAAAAFRTADKGVSGFLKAHQ
tara:strand:+ start:485 stop:661 length:177 start_codon:yes stop_codon:yes gene_type:complete